MSVLQWAVVVSAALAATGAWPGRRIARCHTFWPVPFMTLAIALVVVDLNSLVTGQSYVPSAAPSSGLSTTSLVLGVWAGLVVGYVGWVEITAGQRGSSDGRTLMAPAVMLAIGLAMITASLDGSGSEAAIALPGICILAAGALLLAARSLPSPPNSMRFGWPVALLAGALLVREPPVVDQLVEPKRELAAVLEALQRGGARVTSVDSVARGDRDSGLPLETFRIDGNEVRIYLVAHDGDLNTEVHLSPRVPIPPSTGGVSHLHVGPHILVVCITADRQFARRLDAVVRRLRTPQPATNDSAA